MNLKAVVDDKHQDVLLSTTQLLGSADLQHDLRGGSNWHSGRSWEELGRAASLTDVFMLCLCQH